MTKLSILAVLFCVFALTFEAGAEGDSHTLNIPALPLDEALIEFGRQTRTQISAESSVLEGRKSTPVVGDFSVEQGLEALLQGTGLELNQIDATTFALGFPDQSQIEQKIADEIVVTGHRRDYLNGDASAATGLDLSIFETPAALSVISQDLLKDLQVNNVDEALRNVAGATKFKTGNGGEERYSLRGFAASGSIYKDGARTNSGLNTTIIPSTETANIERIEILKGPSALLYGRGEPGGITNYITKRPESDPYHNIEVLAGSDAFYKVEFDSTNVITEDGRWVYRVVGSYEDSESYQDEIFRKRLMLNPSIAYRATPDLAFLLSVEYTDDDYTQSRGQVLDGNVITGYFYSDRQDPSQFFGIPGFNDQTEVQNVRINFEADYKVNDVWRIKATYNDAENDKEYFDAHAGLADFATLSIIGGAGTPLDNFVVISGANAADSTGEATQFRFRNMFEFDGPMNTEHQLLLSYTLESYEANSERFSSPDTVFFNLLTEQYFLNTPVTPVDPDAIAITLTSTGDRQIQKFEETGVNFVDYVKFQNGFSFLFGARYSSYEDDQSDFDDDDLSFRAGLIYEINETLSVYASYAEGYTSSGGNLNLDDEVIDPETSESFEIGVKWQAIPQRLLLTATVYDTAKQDIAFLVNPMAAPIDFRFDNIGEVVSKGIELELVGNISPNWRIHAGYSYIDNEITEGGTTGSFGPISFELVEGNTLAGIADHNLNLSSFYEIDLADGRLGFGGSLYAQSDSYISSENNYEIDSWEQVDLAIYYKWNQWKAQLNVRNVFDEEYLLTQETVNPDIFAAVRAGTSAPRTVVGSLSYEF